MGLRGKLGKRARVESETSLIIPFYKVLTLEPRNTLHILKIELN